MCDYTVITDCCNSVGQFPTDEQIEKGGSKFLPHRIG